MTRRQVPKSGFRLGWRRVGTRQAEALERIAAILERIEAQGLSEPGGVRGAAGHGPPLVDEVALRRQEAR